MAEVDRSGTRRPGARLPGARRIGKADLPAFLEAAYARFNRPEFISPDPLELVLEYASADDREVVGLLASSLATGTVRGILAGARDALSRLGPFPARAIDELGPAGLDEAFAAFRYRFFPGDDLAAFLSGAAKLRAAHGSLGHRLRALAETCPRSADGAGSLVPALAALGEEIRRAAPRPFKKALFPSPEDGSACKRPFLWMRWMARSDAVDPGPWERGLEPLLVAPLDTHLARVGRTLGLLRSSGTGLKAALELTESFRALRPDDPVRYDFSLTRPGITPCLDPGAPFECLLP